MCVARITEYKMIQLTPPSRPVPEAPSKSTHRCGQLGGADRVNVVNGRPTENCEAGANVNASAREWTWDGDGGNGVSDDGVAGVGDWLAEVSGHVSSSSPSVSRT